MRVYKDKAEIEGVIDDVVKILREQNDGKLLLELAEAMTDVLAGVNESQKAGGVRINIGFKPIDEGTVQVFHEITTKVPKISRGSMFYVTPNNSLSRMDPKQEVLELKRLEDEDRSAGLRVVGGHSDNPSAIRI